MKKLVIWILTAILALSLCACGGGDKAYESSTATDITDKQLQQLIEQAQTEQGN